jgi:parvulin-like peptidyl-prolyl isomerase
LEELASVRHILLLTQDKSEEEKTQIHLRMKEILKRARAGEDFGELAKQYTEDPGSKETGGLYENFGRGTMVPPFEEAAFNVPVGEISDIVETRYGYHILKVVARSTGTKTLDEMKEELKDKLQKGEWNSIVPAHIQTLKTEAEVTLASFLQ